jgi:hypothetical protein
MFIYFATYRIFEKFKIDSVRLHILDKYFDCHKCIILEPFMSINNETGYKNNEPSLIVIYLPGTLRLRCCGSRCRLLLRRLSLDWLLFG